MSYQKCLIIDLGVSNVMSLQNFLIKINKSVEVFDNPQKVMAFEPQVVFLPGVGSFSYANKIMKKSGWQSYLTSFVGDESKLVVGICLGLHLLSEGSDEGESPGMSLLPGHAVRFCNEKLPVPHMGWNEVKFRGHRSTKLDFIDSRFYFTHSYYIPATNSEFDIGISDYGVKFASVLNSKNVYGLQFHPEKSHRYGASLVGRMLDEA